MVLAIVLAAHGYAQAAASSVSIVGSVATPTKTGKLGRIDSSALQEIRAYRAAVGATPWIGMQGTGTITYGSQDTTSYDATLTSAAGSRFRLDAQTRKGEVSIRILDIIGKIQDPDRRITVMDPGTASTGIFPFEFLWAKLFPGPAALIDQGLVSIDGVQLHRITFEFGSLGRNPLTRARNTVAIDYYFSPTSHLLVKSSSSVLVDGNPREHFLAVVTYSDYRQVNSSLIPFCYTETIDGQLSRTLQLSTIQLNPTLSSSYFEF